MLDSDNVSIACSMFKVVDDSIDSCVCVCVCVCVSILYSQRVLQVILDFD